MKRMLLLAVILWTCAARAQDITQAEYYIDTDPGFGNGTPIDISAGADVAVGFTADLSAVDDGIHILYVRARDDSGTWSLSLSHLFLKAKIETDPALDITAMEYFIDHDPGFGAAVPVAFSSAPDINLGFTAGLNGLDTGLHFLNVRAQDASGVWSLLRTVPFLKTPAAADPLPNIVRTEYYIDNDPGFGNGTTVTPASGPDQTLSFSVDLNGLDYGFHTLYTRSRDTGGHWSLPFAHSFFKEVVNADDPASIVQAEYFIDVDPGFGNASAIPLTPGTDLSLSFTADLSGVADGIRILYVRTRDMKGRWSLSHARPFLMQNGIATDPPPNITRIEYFFRKGAEVSSTRVHEGFNPVSDADLNFTAALSGLSSGDWVMQAAAIDAAGRSSLLFTQSIEVTAAAVGDLTLDGVINITDVVALIQIILGQTATPEAGSELFGIADFNGDGTLNILDLIGQINIIVGASAKPVAASTQPVKVEFGEVDMARDNSGLLPLTLSSTGHVAGLQTDLTFDASLLQVGIPYLTNEYAHIRLEHYRTDGGLRLLLYNAEGGILDLPTDTELIIPVTLLDESADDALVTLNETVLAGPQAQSLSLTPGTTTVAVRALPKEFSLGTNRPNPFNPTTQIAYDVPEPAHVTLILYNVLGQEIIRLVDEQKQPGRYVTTWTGKNSTGRTVASGIYLYRMATSSGFTAQRRMTLLK